MSREVDQRDFSENQVTPAREDELRRIASDVSDNVLPGDHRVTVTSFDTTTGNPSAITSIAAPAEKDKYIERAQAHVQSIGRVLGLAETQPTDFVSDPQVQAASSGAKAVYLQQQYKGIPIFQATQTVRFDPEGALKESVGSSITVTLPNGGENWISTSDGLTVHYVSALAINPLQATLYAGTVDGGVFKSTNGGGNWSAFNRGLTHPYVNALAIDPATPSTVYAGTNRGGVFSIQELEHQVYLPLVRRGP